MAVSNTREISGERNYVSLWEELWLRTFEAT